MNARLLFSLLFFVLWKACPAQVSVVEGTRYPENPTEHTWFWNGQAQTAAVYKGGHWINMSGNRKVISLVQCNGFMIERFAPDSYSNDAGDFVVFDAQNVGNGYEAFRHDVYCGDSIICYKDMYDFIEIFPNNFSAYPNRQSPIAAPYWTGCHKFIPDTLSGMEAFCVPGVAPVYEMMHLKACDQKNWGILGTNGRWLIEPKYDAPFRFENGIAEVIYYGKRYKINEQGEFVK